MSTSDAIVLYLVQQGDWVPSYDLIKRELCGKWVGSSGDRRARELAEAGTHIVSGVTYTIERRKVGKYAEYKASGFRTVYELVERNGEKLRVPKLVAV